MAVWRQSNWEGRADPAAVRLVGLLLLGHRSQENLEPLLLSPIPAVDGVIASREFRFRRPGLPVARMRRMPEVRDLEAGRIPEEAARYDFLLWLRPGEVLLTGNLYTVLRETAQMNLGTRLLPVHYPIGQGFTLITLEPRWIGTRMPAGAVSDLLVLPVESGGVPPAEPLSFREEQGWMVLYRAVRALLTGERRTGHLLLEQIFRLTADQAPGLAGLAVRNGMADALAAGDARMLDHWLSRALSFRDYDEVKLLKALAPAVQGDLGRAEAAITRLLNDQETAEDGPWVSGGGERGYRALTLRGRLRAQQGNLKGALADWIEALRQQPDYTEPLRQAAAYRFHRVTLDRMGLRGFERGRPAATARLVKRLYEQGVPPVRRASPPGRPAPGLRWEGAWFTDSSLARVNRELGLWLVKAGWDLSAVPTEPQSYRPPGREVFGPVAERLWRPLEAAAVTVRHCWPPLLEPPEQGKLVVMLPWEYGPLPSSWVGPLQAADQVWVYSEWARRGAIDSGLPPKRVKVVPCGIDPTVFHPPEEPVRAPGPEEPFVFLYVGGTIWRKGYDLALEAFLTEFGPDEPAVLTVKDFGSDSFYRGISGIERIRKAEAATAGMKRQVRVIDRILSDEELARLYWRSHCLVAPYRAEGFCLPALEAMACGTPVILPRFGPALEYAGPGTAILVDAAPVSLGREISGMPLAGEGMACQIRLSDLRRAMRRAYAEREALAEMGRRAAGQVHAHHTWAEAARTADRELRRLLNAGSPEGGDADGQIAAG